MFYLKLLPIPAQMLHSLGLNGSAIHAILAIQELDYVPYRVSDSAIVPETEPEIVMGVAGHKTA